MYFPTSPATGTEPGGAAAVGAVAPQPASNSARPAGASLANRGGPGTRRGSIGDLVRLIESVCGLLLHVVSFF